MSEGLQGGEKVAGKAGSFVKGHVYKGGNHFYMAVMPYDSIKILSGRACSCAQNLNEVC
ncbi:unnamed protein product [Ixodes persulcatus]